MKLNIKELSYGQTLKYKEVLDLAESTNVTIKREEIEFNRVKNLHIIHKDDIEFIFYVSEIYDDRIVVTENIFHTPTEHVYSIIVDVSENYVIIY